MSLIKLFEPDDLLEEIYARLRLVTKKLSAIIVVILFINVALPLAPKTVDEAPDPKAAPASAPFPC